MSFGITPLMDMTAADLYKGEDGGLYGGGSNVPPQSHLDTALAQAALIQPLNSAGQPDAAGKVVMASSGMSNCMLESKVFGKRAAADSEVSDSFLMVTGASNAAVADRWLDPSGLAWQRFDEALAAAGITHAQVQILWMKHALHKPFEIGEFPVHTNMLADCLRTILQLAKQRMPNLRLVYLSSRTYGGYAQGGGNPEPYAFESAFAVRNVIQAQIAGDPELSNLPPVLWGPYLWADGEVPRSDGLTWLETDFTDGVHPSQAGLNKSAALMLAFFKSNPTSTPWFRE